MTRSPAQKTSATQLPPLAWFTLGFCFFFALVAALLFHSASGEAVSFTLSPEQINDLVRRNPEVYQPNLQYLQNINKYPPLPVTQLDRSTLLQAGVPSYEIEAAARLYNGDPETFQTWVRDNAANNLRGSDNIFGISEEATPAAQPSISPATMASPGAGFGNSAADYNSLSDVPTESSLPQFIGPTNTGTVPLSAAPQPGGETQAIISNLLGSIGQGGSTNPVAGLFGAGGIGGLGSGASCTPSGGAGQTSTEAMAAAARPSGSTSQAADEVRGAVAAAAAKVTPSADVGRDANGRLLGPLTDSRLAELQNDRQFLQEVEAEKAGIRAPSATNSTLRPTTVAEDTTTLGRTPAGPATSRPSSSNSGGSSFDQAIGIINTLGTVRQAVDPGAYQQATPRQTQPPQVVNTPATPTQQITLLLNVLSLVVKDMKALPLGTEADFKFYQGIDIWNASLQKLADLFTLASTADNKSKIGAGISPLLQEFQALIIATDDSARKEALTSAVARGALLLTRLADVPVMATANQAAAAETFTQEGAAFQQSLQKIYNLTNDTGAGIPLENAEMIVAGYQTALAEYKTELARAESSGNTNSTSFIEARKRLEAYTFALSQLESVGTLAPATNQANSLDGGSNGGSNASLEQIMSIFQSSGVLGNQQGMQSGLQALNTLSQLRQGGANMGTFANIAQALSQSGAYSGGDSADIGKAISAFGQLENLLHNNQQGVLGLVQTAANIQQLFRQNPVGNSMTRPGGVGSNISAADLQRQSQSVSQATTAANGAKDGLSRTNAQAETARDAGAGKPGGASDLNSGAPGGSGALDQPLGGSNRGVPVNVLSGTPYFKLVTIIRDLNEEICKHVASIDTLQQWTKEKYTDLDKAVSDEALAKAKAESEKVLKTAGEGRTDAYGNKVPYATTLEAYKEERRDIARAKFLKSLDTETQFDQTFSDEVKKTIKQRMLVDKQRTDFLAKTKATFPGKTFKDVRTVRDLLDSTNPSQEPAMVVMSALEEYSRAIVEADANAEAEFIAHQGFPPSIKCADGKKYKNIDGREVCIEPMVDPDQPTGPVLVQRVAAAKDRPIDTLTNPQTIAQKGNAEKAEGAGDPSITRSTPPPTSPSQQSNNGNFLDQLLRGLTAVCRLTPELGICGDQNPDPAQPPVVTRTAPTLALSYATSTINSMLSANISWLTAGAQSCKADNAWTTFGDGTATTLASTTAIQAGGEIAPQCAGSICSQRIFLPNAFRSYVAIRAPVSEQVEPDQSRAFTTSLTMGTKPGTTNATRVSQTTLYTPNVRGIDTGWVLTFAMNGQATSTFIEATQMNDKGIIEAGAIAALIRDTIARIPPTSAIYNEFHKYEYTVVENALRITGHVDTESTLPTQLEYKMSCQNPAGETRDATTVRLR